MKMLKITMGLHMICIYFFTHSHTDLTDFFHKLQFYECSNIGNTNFLNTEFKMKHRVYNMLI